MRRPVHAQARPPMAVMRTAWSAQHHTPTHHRSASAELPRRARERGESSTDDGEPVADTRLVSRAEGYYWLAEDDDREVGPFASIEAALADMGASGDDDEDSLAPDDTLEEVEDELGMSTWIDPDTGCPAEATWTRLEDH